MNLNVYVVTKLPDFVPGTERIDAARAFVNDVLRDEARYVEFHVHPNRRAVGTLMGVDRLQCPRCQKTLALWSDDDLDEWTNSFEEQLFSSPKPLQMMVNMPCCKDRAIGGDFNFQGAVRFSRIELSLYDAFSDSGIRADQLQQLEDILGCELVKFHGFET